MNTRNGPDDAAVRVGPLSLIGAIRIGLLAFGVESAESTARDRCRYSPEIK